MIGAALWAALLYWLLRQMERWLQQHIFKVGWLLTKDYRTTTVLYYVFFLPGVLLHEVALWLMAGVLNVRADRAVQFPAPQEIPELKLNFVRISPRAPKWKLAIIELAPAVLGVFVIALIANSVLDISPALSVMRTGSLEDVAAGFRMLTAIPDFWLWAYVLLTVSNTMSPKVTSRDALLKPMLAVLVVVGVILFALGLAEDAVGALVGALTQLFNVLAAVFGVVVFINAAAIFILAVIENSIERITGDSATIDKHGKLVARKRADLLAERQQARLLAAKTREEERARLPAATDGIPSIYRLQFPLPDAGDSSARRVIMPPPPAALPDAPRHREPDVIELPSDEIEDEEVVLEVPAPPRPQLPPPMAKPPVEDDADDEIDEIAFDDYDEGDKG